MNPAGADLPDPRDPVSVRRRVHAHPELGFCEIRTADLIWHTLHRLGWSVIGGPDLADPTGYAGLPAPAHLEAAAADAAAAGVAATMVDRLAGGHTALVADLEGTRPGPRVAIRVDIDALPIIESAAPGHRPAALGFASRDPGRMHACGHDGHVAVGLDLAARLAADRDFPGSVRLIIQPAEEGVRGAALLTAAGVCEDVDALIAFHLGFGTPLGHVAPAGDLLATTKVRVTFEGVAAHAGNAPQEGRHALLAAATATVGLHGLPRFAGTATRVNVGTMHADGAANIVPARAQLQAEIRAGTAQAHTELDRRAREVIQGAAAMHEVSVSIEVTGSATTAVNDAPVLDALATAAPQAGLTFTGTHPLGASDDATLLMADTQARGGRAAYVLIGSGTYGPHHSPSFDLDESALPAAADLLETAIRAGVTA